GMTIMSGAMHIAGLLGAPRRSSFSEYAGGEQVTEWIGYQVDQAVGGSILFIAILLIVYNVIKMAFFAPKGEEEYLLAEEEEVIDPTSAFFENWMLCIVITLALIIFSYGVPFMNMINYSPPGSPPFDWPIGK